MFIDNITSTNLILRYHIVRFYWNNNKPVVTDQIGGHLIYCVWVKPILSFTGQGRDIEIKLNSDGMPLDVNSKPINIFQQYDELANPKPLRITLMKPPLPVR